jgi:hypothetical protein
MPGVAPIAAPRLDAGSVLSAQERRGIGAKRRPRRRSHQKCIPVPEAGRDRGETTTKRVGGNFLVIRQEVAIGVKAKHVTVIPQDSSSNPGFQAVSLSGSVIAALEMAAPMAAPPLGTDILVTPWAPANREIGNIDTPPRLTV